MITNGITAKVILDSVSPLGQRITTMQLKFHRFILPEYNTHRSFCISGDARLDFELPAGNSRNGGRRIHSMSIRDFVNKWFNGAASGNSPSHNGKTLDHLNMSIMYTAKEVAYELGYTRALNLNLMCREGLILGSKKDIKGRWVALGSSWAAWRSSTGNRRFSIQKRLSSMSIRQLNETTGEVTISSVKNCIISGVKEVFRLSVGGLSTVATADHQIFTDNGWKRLGDLVVGVDKICMYKYGTKIEEDPHKKIDGKWVSTWNNKIRKEVADRQDNKCLVTGDDLESSFHIHHVIPKHERPDLAFTIDNVIAVNSKAHLDLHSKQGWQVGNSLGSQFMLIDSITAEGTIDTYDLEIDGEFSNFFADGIVVHNSRNASSSRAIPVKTMLKQVWNDPAMPVHWGANQAGMQAKAELTGFKLSAAKFAWRTGAKLACVVAWSMNKIGLHKQIANRVLEPWQFIHVIMTSTEWDNFFNLRDHPDAQPEIQVLAKLMKDAIKNSVPQKLDYGQWHLPYVSDWEKLEYSLVLCQKISTARCCRVSYLTHDGKITNIYKDEELHDMLVGAVPIHASPTEHQAAPAKDLNFYSNFKGWSQYRQLVEYKLNQ